MDISRREELINLYPGIEELIRTATLRTLFNHKWLLIICEIVSIDRDVNPYMYEIFCKFLKQQLEVRNGNA